MEKEELQKLIQQETELVSKIQATKKAHDKKDDTEQYDPENHPVTDVGARPNKTVLKPTPTVTDPDKVTEETVYVNRIVAAIQKLIVSRKVAFLVGGGILLDAEVEKGSMEELILQMLKRTWKTNKLDYKTKEIAKILDVEKECAELWFTDVEEGYWKSLNLPRTGKMRCLLLHPENGDKLFPVFDSKGNMIAFGRGYEIEKDDKTVEHFDLYTDELILQHEDGARIARIKNPTGKIPVIYGKRNKVAWSDVQSAIERLETLLSNHADTNDYNGSPILKATGQIKGFSSKGESGKVFELEDGGDLDYVTWNSAPESIKMEIENLFNLIYTVSQTPNISFTEMKNIGQVSGIALKLLFLDATIKAKDEQDGQFGEFIQRRINFLLNAMAIIHPAVEPATTLDVTPVFKDFLPNNLVELVEIYVSLTGAGIMSKETALEQLDLVKDLRAEIEKLNEQREREAITIEE